MLGSSRQRLLVYTAILFILTSGTRQVAAQDNTFHEKLIEAPNETAIEGSYVVAFAESVADSIQDRANLLTGISAFQNVTLGRVYDGVFKGFSVTIPKGDTRERRYQRLQLILQDPAVDFIEEEQVFKKLIDQNFPPSWGLDRIDQTSLPLDRNYHYDFNGTGITAYIVDTGIRSTHVEFEGRVNCGFNAFEGDESCEDLEGHGTHVASIVGGATYGVAKGVQMITVKVLNKNGEGTTSGILAGINYLAHHDSVIPGPSVANLSLGGYRSQALNTALTRAYANGVFMVTAAGNEGDDACLFSPASAIGGLTVGAITSSDEVAGFSNVGTCVDIFAPGSNIEGAYKDSDTDIAILSGTSMAAPFVTGAAVLYRQHYITSSVIAIKQSMIEDAVVGNITGLDLESPNLLVNTENLFSTTPVPPDPSVPDPNSGAFFSSSTVSWTITLGMITVLL